MDSIFKALNDPARRAILDSLRLRDGQTLTELERQFDMSRFGVMKHLGVLEEAHLITTRKEGRFKYHYLNALPLQEVIDRWIGTFLKPQVAALSSMKSDLERRDKMSKPDFVTQTYINCTQDALWTALTDVSQKEHYDFLGQTARRDGDLVVYVAPDGTETLHCRDLESTPKSRLVTSFEPKWNGADAKPSRVVYLIEPEGEYCKLTVEHYDLTYDPAGGTADGWHRTLAGLKSWLESGTPSHFGGAHLWEEEQA